MILESTLSELKYHAGLIMKDKQICPSIAECTWIPNGMVVQVSQAGNDVIRLLGQLNIQLNGSNASDLTNKSQMIPRQVVFAVQEIIRMLRKAATEVKDRSSLENLVQNEERISLAWYGVLCGDVENIELYVSNETDH